MSKSKNVKIEKVIKSDASYEVFTYFRGLLEMSCLDEHFAKANLSLLSKKSQTLMDFQLIFRKKHRRKHSGKLQKSVCDCVGEGLGILFAV